MEQIASLDKLRECLYRIRKSGDYQYLQDLITELHFIYELYRFKKSIEEPKDLQTLINVAYYLIGAFSNPINTSKIISSVIEDGLSISALVFELLGKYADIENQSESRDEFNLNAAIAYSLSKYQANSAVLAQSLFVEKLLTNDNSIAQIGKNCIFALLGRKYFWLQKNSRQLLRLVNFNSHLVTTELQDLLFLTPTNSFWELLVYAAILLSRFLVQGDDTDALESIRLLEKAKQLATDYDLLEELWLAARLLDCEIKIIEQSTWKVLRKHSFSEQYISTLTRFPQNAVHELWDSQLKALENVDLDESDKKVSLFSDEVSRALVSMPTSAGKTLIAELAIIKVLESHPGAKCVYIAPSRALVDEIEEKLRRRFRFLGYKVANVIGGFDLGEQERMALQLDSADVLVLTPEKLDYIFHKREEFTNHIKLFVFDEAHKIGDNSSRGWFLETLIAWLFLKPNLIQTKFILMSAVIANNQRTDLRLWIGQQKLASFLPNEWSPSRQVISILYYQGSEEFLGTKKNKKGNDEREFKVKQTANLQIKYKIAPFQRTISDLYELNYSRIFNIKTGSQKKGNGSETWYDRSMHIIKLLSTGQTPQDSTLVYFQQKKDLVSFCKRASKFFQPIDDPRIDKLISYIEKRLGKKFPIIDSLSYGIAFHHGDLPQDVRNEIENAYKDKIIKVLACTTTLAEGVNLSVKTFILGYPKTFYGNRISVRDFKNIVGRAGRALIDTEGTIIVIRHPDFEQEDIEYLNSLVEMSDKDLQIQSYIERLDIDNNSLSQELELFSQALIEKQNETQKEIDDNIENFLNRLQVFVFSLYEDSLIKGVTGEAVAEAFSSTFLYSRSNSSAKLKENVVKASLNFLNVCTNLDSNRLRRFNSSGLSFYSNRFLENLCGKLFEKTKAFSLSTDLSIAKIMESQDIIDIYKNIREATPKYSEFFSDFQIIDSLDHYSILLDWVSGEDFDFIRDKYFKEVDDIVAQTQLCQSYIAKQFIYKLPWVFASIHTHLEAYNTTPLIKTWFDTLPAQIKYGVDTPEAVYFSANGIHSRFLARRLAEIYRTQNTDFDLVNFEAIESWFFSLSPFSLQEQAADLPELAIRQAIRRINAIRKPTRNLQIDRPAYFYIAGWQHYQGEEILGNLMNLVSGSEKPNLFLEHDVENEYDEFAVAVYFETMKLGYVPRAYNEEIANFLALGTPLNIRLNTISNTKSPTGYRNVEVIVSVE